MTTGSSVSERLRRKLVEQPRRCRRKRAMPTRCARVARLPSSLLTHALALRDAA